MEAAEVKTSEFKPGVANDMPVPDSIEGGFSNPRVRCLCENGEWHSWDQRKELGYTHWCLLPEIPKPKSQAELDEERISAIGKDFWASPRRIDNLVIALKTAITYARTP
jgi:hypothetical protein